MCGKVNDVEFELSLLDSISSKRGRGRGPKMEKRPSPLCEYERALTSSLNSATHLSFFGAAGYTLSSDGSITAYFAVLDDVTDYTSEMCYTKFIDPIELLLE
ncbi:hypothetical protein DOTSEDRAFT_37877 [Dothistroma septosporum NZE10]|uniref:Uncharacterized protein n=1 Tax=Dothistroma septosporum (strain NZE10 / CBS 128990) TaxID=675120 RepID=N1PEV3_DOTSN|nr:hypothetical protein DOTSEDRAFT_37877 [Dothistroma septosporum NZE10]